MKKNYFLKKKWLTRRQGWGLGMVGLGDWGFTTVYIAANSSLIVGIPNPQSPLVQLLYPLGAIVNIMFPPTGTPHFRLRHFPFCLQKKKYYRQINHTQYSDNRWYPEHIHAIKNICCIHRFFFASTRNGTFPRFHVFCLYLS